MRLVPLSLAVLVLGGACGAPPTQDAALHATVVAPAGLTSTCVLVRAEGASGVVHTTRPLAFTAPASFEVGIARSDLGPSVRLVAEGYTGAQCEHAVSPPERAIAQSVAFAAGKVVAVTLTLAPVPSDGGVADAGAPPDAGPGDAGSTDAGVPDSGVPDAGPGDAGPPEDAGSGDAGPPDAGELDAGLPDAGPFDAGPFDAGPVDAGLCSSNPALPGSCGARGGTCAGDLCSFFSYTPSNFTEADLPYFDGGARLDVTCSATLDTGSGATPPHWTLNPCALPLPPVALLTGPTNGADLALFALNALTVDAGATLTLIGARAPVFAVVGSAWVGGVLDVSGRQDSTGGVPGPGGDVDCFLGSGGDGASGSAVTPKFGAGGGGGGGFGGKGGDGTRGDLSSAAQARGGEVGGTQGLSPLRGGCSGGRGGTVTGSWVPQGAAGGALQLSVAQALTLVGTGKLKASGQGGVGGAASNAGGGGAGSGGAILLEAAELSLGTGAVTANGGSGGQGADDNTDGTWGEAGLVLEAAATTPGASGCKGGAGGEGGFLGTPEGLPAGAPTGSLAGGGGGGGGAGRIRFNVKGSCASSAATISPRATSLNNKCP